MSSSRYPISEAFLVALGTFAFFAGLRAIGNGNDIVALVADAVIPLVFFWVPLCIIFIQKRSLHDYGLNRGEMMASLRTGAIVALVVLPLFTVGYWLWWSVLLKRTIHLHLGITLIRQIPIQLLVVALPEEIFFRGYLQTLLAKGWPGRKLPLIGTDVLAILSSSALFALAHFVTHPSLYRLGVFFPGLLFGVLRSCTGSIAAPVVLHLLANLLIFVLMGKV